MELLSDVAHVESHFGSFGDSANLDVRLVHYLRQTNHSSEIISDTANGTPR
jgi:hypothetical protein